LPWRWMPRDAKGDVAVVDRAREGGNQLQGGLGHLWLAAQVCKRELWRRTVSRTAARQLQECRRFQNRDRATEPDYICPDSPANCSQYVVEVWRLPVLRRGREND
jgi:hypothetical protein